MPLNKNQIASLKPSTVTLLGIPWDENSSFRRGTAEAPPRIRDALHCGSMNLCSENGIDLGDNPRFTDLGDLDISSDENTLSLIEDTVSGILSQGAIPLSLGGDHAVTYPIIKAFHKKYGSMNILHFDAHPDLYDEYEGNRFSHACPFARIMEEGLAKKLVSIGIRTMNPHQRSQADKYGVQVIEMKEWYQDYPIDLKGPLYLSVDIDALDPFCAPGVSHHEPGGLTTRELIRMIRGISVPIVGADIVEYNPQRDIHDMTAMTAAKLLKEIAGTILAGITD